VNSQLIIGVIFFLTIYSLFIYLFIRKGVNMRHMGLVRSALSGLTGTGKDEVMQLMLREMVVRVCKNLIRRQMRQRMLKLRYSRDEPFKEIIVGFLNLIGTITHPRGRPVSLMLSG
jgi:hypothetical protein